MYAVNPTHTAVTGAASGAGTSGATLTGTSNATGLETTAFFQYGASSGSYTGTSSTQSVSGTSDTALSIALTGLSAGTTYYYRLANQHYTNLVYGSEASFTTTSGPVAEPTRAPETFTVTSTNPSDGAAGVAVTTTVSATFSLLVNGSTVTTDTFTLSDGSSLVSGAVSTNGATVTFAPSSGLAHSTTYTATLTTGIKAANYAGTQMTSNYSWSFTTIAATPTPTATPIVTPTPTPAQSPTATPTPPEYCKLYGFVQEYESNDPIGSVSVSLRRLGTETERTKESDRYGFFKFEDLEVNRYLLKSEKELYRRIKKMLKVEEGEVRKSVRLRMRRLDTNATPTAEPTATPLPTRTAAPSPVPTITPTPATTPTAPGQTPTPSPANTGMVFGYVTDSEGAPIGSVKVRIRKLRSDEEYETTSSDADGFYEFTNLKAGKHMLKAKKSSYRRHWEIINLREGETQMVDIVMK